MPRAPTQADLARAKHAFDRGDYLLASELIRGLLAHQPSNTSWLYLLACAEGELGRVGEARRIIERGLTIDPNHRGLLTRLARALFEAGDAEAAHDAIDRAIATSPKESRPISVKAEILEYEGRSAEAAALLERAMATCEPRYPLAIVLARVCRSLGRSDEALRAVLPLRDDESIPPPARRTLLFALGELLDRLERYDEAFDAYARANALRQGGFDPDGFDRSVDLMIERWTPGCCEASAVAGERAAFIMGLPRTGTSLLEQMLSRSERIHGAGELPLIRGAAHALRLCEVRGLDHVHAVSRLHERLLSKHAREYLERHAPRDCAASLVTDKDPINIEHAGLIHAMLPSARIVRCTRHPLDTLISIFFQEFRTQLPWAGDIEHIARYSRAIARLSDHWRNALGVPMLDVAYEDLASRTEPTLRAVFAHLGEAFDERSLRPHESTRVVRTASNQQVREAIHTRSIERWRHYEKHLGRARQILGLT